MDTTLNSAMTQTSVTAEVARLHDALTHNREVQHQVQQWLSCVEEELRHLDSLRCALTRSTWPHMLTCHRARHVVRGHAAPPPKPHHSLHHGDRPCQVDRDADDTAQQTGASRQTCRDCTRTAPCCNFLSSHNVGGSAAATAAAAAAFDVSSCRANRVCGDRTGSRSSGHTLHRTLPDPFRDAGLFVLSSNRAACVQPLPRSRDALALAARVRVFPVPSRVLSDATADHGATSGAEYTMERGSGLSDSTPTRPQSPARPCATSAASSAATAEWLPRIDSLSTRKGCAASVRCALLRQIQYPRSHRCRVRVLHGLPSLCRRGRTTGRSPAEWTRREAHANRGGAVVEETVLRDVLRGSSVLPYWADPTTMVDRLYGALMHAIYVRASSDAELLGGLVALYSLPRMDELRKRALWETYADAAQCRDTDLLGSVRVRTYRKLLARHSPVPTPLDDDARSDGQPVSWGHCPPAAGRHAAWTRLVLFIAASVPVGPSRRQQDRRGGAMPSEPAEYNVPVPVSANEMCSLIAGDVSSMHSLHAMKGMKLSDLFGRTALGEEREEGGGSPVASVSLPAPPRRAKRRRTTAPNAE